MELWPLLLWLALLWTYAILPRKSICSYELTVALTAISERIDATFIKKVRGTKMNRLPLILTLLLMLLVLQVPPALASPTGSIMCEVLIFSADKKGYDVFQDGVFLGKEGIGSDLPDGNYRLFVTGNMKHTIAIDDGKFTYGMKDFYFTAGVPHSISVDSSEMKLGPAGIYRKPGAPGSSQGAEATRQQGLQNPLGPSAYQNHLNVNIANDVYTQRDRRIYYCQEGNMMLIKNRIYLTGPDLGKVQRVKYVLHPSFPNPEQVSDNPSNNFEIWIMTWGRFPLTAIITTKDGMTFNKAYDFTFKSKVEEAMRMGIPMVSHCA